MKTLRINSQLPKLSPSDIARFEAKVDRAGGPKACWPWKAGLFPEGYGEFWVGSKNNGGRMYLAHRIAYQIKGGSFPRENLVCHSCDNPPCCNPVHLWLGGDVDNARDKEAKGRSNNHTGDAHWSRKKPRFLARGSSHGSRLRPEKTWKGIQIHTAKLNDYLVKQIRIKHGTGNFSYAQLGRLYGVSTPNIRYIVIRRTWKHVK
jgi:hypothetical protein